MIYTNKEYIEFKGTKKEEERYIIKKKRYWDYKGCNQSYTFCIFLCSSFDNVKIGKLPSTFYQLTLVKISYSQAGV